VSADLLVFMGVFGAPHGIKGEIRVKSFADEPEAIGAYGALVDASGGRVFDFERRRSLKGSMLIVKIKGVDTREAAAALTGVEIFARRSQLPPTSEGEFYHADLVGLEAVTREGAPMGRIASVVNYGAGDILEVERPDGEILLLPFTKAVAPKIDLDGGRIVIEPPLEVAARSEPAKTESRAPARRQALGKR